MDASILLGVLAGFTGNVRIYMYIYILPFCSMNFKLYTHFYVCTRTVRSRTGVKGLFSTYVNIVLYVHVLYIHTYLHSFSRVLSMSLSRLLRNHMAHKDGSCSVTLFRLEILFELLVMYCMHLLYMYESSE